MRTHLADSCFAVLFRPRRRIRCDEGSWARNISRLRKVLGDGTDDVHYIETISRRGYRFVTPVVETREDGPSAPGPLPFCHSRTCQDFFADGMTDELISYRLLCEARRPGPAAGAADPEDTAPDLVTAAQSQLGLKLEQGTAGFYVLVIDQIEKKPFIN
jgi:hypothetical protein